jgi:hypothetical protein
VESIALIVLALLLRQALQGGDSQVSQISTIPAADCRPSTLVLDDAIFLIRDLPPAADGSLSVPLDTPGIAYRLRGAQGNPAFVLSPTSENLVVVSTIELGSHATVTWPDCTFTNYRVSAHQMGSFNALSLAEQSTNGTSFFFPIDASSAGFLFTAELSSDQIYVTNPRALLVAGGAPTLATNTPAPALENTLPPSPTNTLPPSPDTPTPTPAVGATVPSSTANSPAPPLENTSTANTSTAVAEDTEVVEENLPPPPDSSAVEADLGPVEVLTAPDAETIRLKISVQNTGGSAFTFSADHVSLRQADDTPLAMISSEPSLPKLIASEATETFILTFPRPSSSISTLTIFTVVYEVEGY